MFIFLPEHHSIFTKHIPAFTFIAIMIIPLFTELFQHTGATKQEISERSFHIHCLSCSTDIEIRPITIVSDEANALLSHCLHVDCISRYCWLFRAPNIVFASRLHGVICVFLFVAGSPPVTALYLFHACMFTLVRSECHLML
jgi:hypothetical protein